MRSPMRRMRILGALVCGLVLGGAGCLQIETRIKVNEDGSAKVTERIGFSERLVQLAGEKRGELAALLGKERLLERMKQMGEGLTLVSHETRTGGDGWVESVAEIAVPDLNKFRYVSPWLARGDYAENSVIRAKLYPQYRSGYYGTGPAGTMAVEFNLEPMSKARPAPPRNDAGPPTPRDQQVYRDIGPVLKDMLKGFRVRLALESYAPVHSGLGVRGAGSTVMDLLDVSDANLDPQGKGFFDNEEVMLELARWELGGANVVQNVSGYGSNLTLPVFAPIGSERMWWTGGGNIWFAPSKALFDKHFAGKNLDFDVYLGPNKPPKTPARFEAIGWQGWKEGQTKTNAAPATPGAK